MIVAIISAVLIAGVTPQVNPDAKLVADFDARVSKYVQLRDQAESALPGLKSTASPTEVTAHEHALAKQIQSLRTHAKQGEIFTPDIAAEFKRLLRIASSGQEDTRIRKSLQHAEPIKVRVKVNGIYPRSLPVQSTPPALLLNLPRLPKELEYRIDGSDLILLDTGASLVVDIAKDVVPASVSPAEVQH